MTLGEWIKAERLKRNMTLEQVAQAYDLRKGNLSKIERGQAPSLYYIMGIARAFGMKEWELMKAWEDSNDGK